MPGKVAKTVRPDMCSQCRNGPSIQCAQCNRWLCRACARDDMDQCRLCPLLQAQQGQVQPPELTDITRGKKAKPPQSLLPTDMRKGAGKGGKGKAKGKGTYGGGASQPTTYHEVCQAIEHNLPLLRAAAQSARATQMAAPGHSHAAQVRVKGGETLRAAFLCVCIGVAFGALCILCVVHFVRLRDGRCVC